MKFQLFKRLFANDFQQQYKDLINQLANSINIALQNHDTAILGNLSLADNVFCNVVTFQVITDAKGKPTASTIVKLTNSTATVAGVHVLQATEASNVTNFPPGAVFVSYTQSNISNNSSNNNAINTISIQQVTGLTPNIQYSIKIVVYFQ